MGTGVWVRQILTEDYENTHEMLIFISDTMLRENSTYIILFSNHLGHEVTTAHEDILTPVL